MHGTVQYHRRSPAGPARFRTLHKTHWEFSFFQNVRFMNIVAIFSPPNLFSRKRCFIDTIELKRRALTAPPSPQKKQKKKPESELVRTLHMTEQIYGVTRKRHLDTLNKNKKLIFVCLFV